MDDMIRFFNETPPRGCMTAEFTKPFSHGWDHLQERDDRRETIEKTPPSILASTETPSISEPAPEHPKVVLKARAKWKAGPRWSPIDDEVFRVGSSKRRGGGKDRWNGTNIQAYLVFQPQPECFSEPQWTEWKHYALLAATGVGDNGGIGSTALSPHCADCSRKYQTEMRKAGRCAHPEVKFLQRRAYIDPDRAID